MRKTILVDLDGIVVNFLPKLIKKYNELYLPSYYSEVVIEEVIYSKITDCKKVNNHVWKIIDEPGFFKDLPAIDGAIEALKEIKKAGHEIVICSTPSRSSESWFDKVNWIKKNLKIRSNKNIILTGAKYLTMGDVLIDDTPRNAESWLKNNPKGIAVQINWPYNSDSIAQIKADSWKDTRNAWKIILESIL